MRYVPLEALQAQHTAATDEMQKSFAALMVGYAAGKVIDMTATLKSLPLKLKTMEDYAHQVLE